MVAPNLSEVDESRRRLNDSHDSREIRMEEYKGIEYKIEIIEEEKEPNHNES